MVLMSVPEDNKGIIGAASLEQQQAHILDPQLLEVRVREKRIEL
ncbi:MULTISPECIES: hypothetical protein [Antarcticibacterium]|nr:MULTISPECIES: hypothetical protein [Antarcticibacterium]